MRYNNELENIIKSVDTKKCIDAMRSQMKYSFIQSLGMESVKVYTNEKMAIDWIQENHNSFFRESPTDREKSRIICIYYDDFCFQSYSRFKKKKMFLYDNGEEIDVSELNVKIWFNRLKNYIHINLDNSHILMLDRNVKDNLRVPARLCREVLLNSIGKFPSRFHAASIVDKENNAWLIMGEKGRGKTSLFLGALHGGYSLCSNDRTILCFDEGGEMCVYAVPTSIRISEEQLQTISKITGNGLMLNQAFDDISTKGGKKEFSAMELCEYFQVGIKNGRRLAGVIVPEFSQEKINCKVIEEKEVMIAHIKTGFMASDNAFPLYYEEETTKSLEAKVIEKLTQLPWLKVSGWLYDIQNCFKYF